MNYLTLGILLSIAKQKWWSYVVVFLFPRDSDMVANEVVCPGVVAVGILLSNAIEEASVDVHEEQGVVVIVGDEGRLMEDVIIQGSVPGRHGNRAAEVGASVVQAQDVELVLDGPGLDEGVPRVESIVSFEAARMQNDVSVAEIAPVPKSMRFPEN